MDWWINWLINLFFDNALHPHSNSQVSGYGWINICDEGKEGEHHSNQPNHVVIKLMGLLRTLHMNQQRTAEYEPAREATLWSCRSLLSSAELA